MNAILRALRIACFYVCSGRRWSGPLAMLVLRGLGMEIGRGTRMNALYVTWPHKVWIGDGCRFEHDVYFKHDGPYTSTPSIYIGRNTFIGSGVEFNIRANLTIGEDCLIASGVRFIDHDHSFADVHRPIRVQGSSDAPIILGNDVWIGANVVILKGVRIETGAVVAAGAVVRQSIPEREIWAGVPARRISTRVKSAAELLPA